MSFIAGGSKLSRWVSEDISPMKVVDLAASEGRLIDTGERGHSSFKHGVQIMLMNQVKGHFMLNGCSNAYDIW